VAPTTAVHQPTRVALIKATDNRKILFELGFITNEAELAVPIAKII
jgi:N-acetylmuramoyl-L-alanine amidase